MANNGVLDMALDDIIDKSKSGRRRGGGGAARNGGGGGAVRNTRRTGGRSDNRAKPYGSGGLRGGQSAVATPISDKIVVSNLAKTVSQDDIRQLFSEIGPVRSAQLNYDAQGRSKGVATIVFTRANHAAQAIKEFHNRTLDQKPMKIELIVSATAPVLSASGRLGGAVNGGRRSGGPAAGGSSGGRNAGRGGRGRRSDGGAPRTHKKTPKSADELDAEMAAYMRDDAGMEVDGGANLMGAAATSQLNGSTLNMTLANALNGA